MRVFKRKTRIPWDAGRSEGLSPLESILTANRAHKPFGIHTYIFIGLKVPWNQYLQKWWGGGALYSS